MVHNKGFITATKTTEDMGEKKKCKMRDSSGTFIING
jgi:hypothetical protein